MHAIGNQQDDLCGAKNGCSVRLTVVANHSATRLMNGNQLQATHSTLAPIHFIVSFAMPHSASEMTYTVSGGSLTSTHSLTAIPKNMVFKFLLVTAVIA